MACDLPGRVACILLGTANHQSVDKHTLEMDDSDANTTCMGIVRMDNGSLISGLSAVDKERRVGVWIYHGSNSW